MPERENHPRRGPRKPPAAPIPPALGRCPRTDLRARIETLDEGVAAAIQAVAARLRARIDASASLDQMRLLAAKAQLLLAMRDTHASIATLVRAGPDRPELSVDALALTRVQLERCFLALLIEDQPGRWFKRYCKNAWKAFAEKFYHDRCSVGHHPGYAEYFGPNGTGVTMLRQFARELEVWEDEFQTLRLQATGDPSDDPRFEPRYIADMPTPARCLSLLEDPTRRDLARLLYPYYSTLSHFSHGGLFGVMQAAILRGESGSAGGDCEEFYRRHVLETTLPVSYVSMLLTATLIAVGLDDNADLLKLLSCTWQPYHSDGSLMGIAVWDSWARSAVGATD